MVPHSFARFVFTSIQETEQKGNRFPESRKENGKPAHSLWLWAGFLQFLQLTFEIRALVPDFSACCLAIFNGFHGAAADTGHAVGAAIAPDRLAVSHLDVAEGASCFTFAAANAGAGGRKRLGFDIALVKQRVDDPGFGLVQKADLCGWEVLTRLDPRCALFQYGTGLGNDGQSFWRLGRPEHHDVVVRHDHRQRTVIAEPQSFAKGFIFDGGISDLPAAGHDKVGISAAGKPAGSQEFLIKPRELPGIGGCHEDPGGFR